MALAEATVRIVLDASRFERELRDKVQRAASAAGRDFDRQMRRQMATTARTAGREFRTATRDSMLRAGRGAADGFDVAFRQGLSRTAGRAGQRLGQGLRVSVGRAGLDAGKRFAQNMTTTLASSGQDTARAYSERISHFLTQHFGRVGRATGRALTRNMGNATVGEMGKVGRRAAREFSASFDIGIGSARLSRSLVIALGAAATSLIQPLGAAMGILAGTPSVLAAVSVAAGVTAVSIMGMADAFKAVSEGDVDDLADSMDRLAPAAQSMVREFAAARPELLAFREEIQNVFFSQLQGEIRKVSASLRGPLRGGILNVAEAAGVLTREFASTLSTPANLDSLNRTLRGTGNLLDELRPGIRSVTTGLLEMAGRAAPGLWSIGRALSELLTRFGRWMSEMGRSGQALVWIEQGIEGFREFGAAAADVAQILRTVIGALSPLTFALGGLFDIMSLVADVFDSLPGPVQSLALALLLLRRTGAVDFFQNLVNSARSMGSQVRTETASVAQSYRSSSQALATFAEHQRMLTHAVGQTPTVLSRFQSGLDSLRATALGTGTALQAGLGRAVQGLLGALGGGWGVAITGAVVALGALASSQQQAQQRAAEHRAAVAELADTLNRQTGAVTAATRQLLADKAAREGWLSAARELGISASDFVDALTGQEQALSRVQGAMEKQVRSAIEAGSEYRSYREALDEAGISLDDLAAAASGNQDAIDKLHEANTRMGGSLNALITEVMNAGGDAFGILAGALNTTNKEMDEAATTTRDAAAAMDPASQAAQRFSDVLGILADNTADADAKARALNEALNILAGGTVSAEVAQGRFTELLARLDDQLEDSTEGLKGMGDAMLNNQGRIDTSTQAGAYLIDVYSQLTTQLSETAAKTIEAGEANGNLDQALIKVARQTQAAREQFISAAQQLGLNQTQAERLADAYGLIPAEVLTTVTDQGSAENTRLQVLGVYQQLSNLPPNTPVKVEGLTEDAIAKLEAVGVKVESLPDGSFRVTAKTSDAVSELQGLVNSWTGRVIQFVASITGFGQAMGGILPKARGGIVGYAEGGTHRLRPMAANRAEIVPPNTWRVIGDRAVGDEAYIPITKSARSRAILATTARRMGFDLVPTKGQVTAPQRVVQVDEGAIQVNAPFADPELVARSVVNELARYAVT